MTEKNTNMINQITTPEQLLHSFRRFIRMKTFSGILLILVTLMAILWANSNLGHYYFHFLHTKISFGIGGYTLSHTMHHWINDGLMAVFFFTIGLEIKREVMVGHLSKPKDAMLPIISAIGGICIPAVIFILLNANSGYLSGWGIPVATDIAFSLGILRLLGKRIPFSITVFLTSLAIVDDIGAVLIIAFFYTPNIQVIYLLIAAGTMTIMLIINFLHVDNIPLYIILAIFGLWLPLLLSGVHATIAGVLAAFTIPARRKLYFADFAQNIKRDLKRFKHSKKRGKQILTTEQQDVIDDMKENCVQIESPMQRLEHTLHSFVIYFIAPVFAFTNTGIIFKMHDINTLFSHPISWGVFFGLFVGKCIGITLFAWLACKLHITSLPDKIKWKQLIGVAFLGGIGFTMSLFITDLAFESTQLIDISKKAILMASLISGIAGFFILKSTFHKKSKANNN